MKKKTLLAAGLVLLLSAGWFYWQLFATFRPAVTRVPHPESEIRLTIDAFGETRTVEVAFLRRLFGRSYVADWDDPICPFGPITITFVHGRDRVVFIPAADDCEFVRYGNAQGFAQKLFFIPTEDKRKLQVLWRRLGAFGRPDAVSAEKP